MAEIITAEMLQDAGLMPQPRRPRVLPRRVGHQRVGLGRLGSDSAPTLTEQVRTIYDGVVQLDPIIGFAGDHPYLFISLFMAVIGAGAAVGAFIGGGGVEILQEEFKKGRR